MMISLREMFSRPKTDNNCTIHFGNPGIILILAVVNSVIIKN